MRHVLLQLTRSSDSRLGHGDNDVICDRSSSCVYMLSGFTGSNLSVMLMYWSAESWAMRTMRPVPSQFPRREAEDVWMSPPCLEPQGCHLIPLYHLLSCSSAESCYTFCGGFFSSFFSCPLAYSSDFLFSPENPSIFFVKRFFCFLFCMADV